ncbi:serine hydrolase domain-containing protein [Agromyces larvae]|uniref:Beta-lactamase family protein n=1 Tax=Agromyces larvae TaxID=2929802 RepID=A0ABY4BVZ1_9MICO|nr:serine hydrolase domain-containing protein [Agromyces larvae]UOE43388.1 beta-lactamase family protein [Agromyces larvae]
MGSKQDHLDQLVDEVLAGHGIPNLAAVMVHDDGQVVISSVAGVKDTSAPPSPANTVTAGDYFNVGSVSKPLTGFLIACLIKQGLLHWDTRIVDVFPEFADPAFRARCGMNDTFLEITVAQLMSHTSGMNGWYYLAPNDSTGRIRDTDPFRFIQDQGIQFADNPRSPEWQTFGALIYQRYLYTILNLKKERFHYGAAQSFHYDTKFLSGYGSTATTCASMVERLSGKPFEQLFDELLPVHDVDMRYGPLPGAMQFHTFDLPTSAYRPLPHYNNDFSHWLSKFVVGGIHLSVGGMAAFIRHNLRAVDSSAVFDVAAYQTKVTDATQGGLYGGGGTGPGAPALNHSGATEGSIAVVYIHAHDGYGYAVMQNNAGGPSGDAQLAMVKHLRKMHDDWATI